MSLPTSVASNKHFVKSNFKVMKNLIKRIPAIAFAIAIAAAFAFNVPQEEALSSVWYSLDTSGNVQAQMSQPPSCEIGSVFCAVEIDDSQLLNGQPQFTNVTDPGADQYYIRYVEKL